MAFQMFRYNLLLLHCNYAPCVWYSSIIIIQYITQILHLPYKLNPLIIMMQILASTKVAMPLFSDFCVNRQPRAAYRCNMDTKVGFLKPSNQVLCTKTNGHLNFCQRAYCFRLGTSCYIWHDPVTGSIHQSGGLFSKICSADTFIQEFLTRLSGWPL